MAVACRDVEAAALARDGSPPITQITFPTCRAHYPGGSSGCACRLLPRSRGLPQMAGGSASALSLSRPAQASLTLRPVGLLSRLKRPLSRGSSPSGYPAEPLVSYQINRQLSGWNLPPLVIRAFGAHCHNGPWGSGGAARLHHADTSSLFGLPRRGAGTPSARALHAASERQMGELQMLLGLDEIVHHAGLCAHVTQRFDRNSITAALNPAGSRRGAS